MIPPAGHNQANKSQLLRLAWLLCAILIIMLWGFTAEALRQRQSLLHIRQQTDHQHWLQQAALSLEQTLLTLGKDMSYHTQSENSLVRQATIPYGLQNKQLWLISRDSISQPLGPQQTANAQAVNNVRRLLGSFEPANKLQLVPTSMVIDRKQNSELMQVIWLDCNEGTCNRGITGFVNLHSLLGPELLSLRPILALMDENSNIIARTPPPIDGVNASISGMLTTRLERINLQLGLQWQDLHTIRSFNTFTLGAIAGSLSLTCLLLLLLIRVSQLLKRHHDEQRQLLHSQQMLSLTNTSLREKMRKLIDEQRDQQTLIETVQVGVLIVDSRDLSILTCNDAAARLTGMSRQLLQQQVLPDLFVHAARCHELLAVLQEQEIVTDREAQLQSRNDQTCWSMTSMRYLQFRERHAIAISLIDISERIAHAQRLQDEKLATEHALSQLQATQHELYQRATTDDLTGLPNRRHFMANANRIIEKCRSVLTQNACIALLDLDHFKQINDRYGHPAGDAALVFFSRELQAALPADAMAGRMGGEEFAIILPECGLQEAHLQIDQIRESLASQQFRVNEHTLQLTFSAGIACSQDEQALDQLLQSADEAMYRAKASGRNRVEIAA